MSIRSRLSGFAAALTVAGFAAGFPAHAQLAPWGGNSDVLVDQSVTGGATTSAPMASLALPPANTGLLPPPSRMPRSELLVARPPVGGGAAANEPELPRVTLTPPSKRSTAARRPTRSKPKMSSRAALAPEAPPTPLAKPEAPKVAPPPPPPAAKKEAPAQMAAKEPAKAPEKAPKKPMAKPEPKPMAKAPEKPQAKMPAKAPEVPAPPKAPAVAPAAPPPPPVKEAAKEEAKPAPKPAPEKQASLSQPAEEPPQSITFDPGGAELTKDAGLALDAVADTLNGKPELRLQLLAYAGEPNLPSSKARRLSLSRALAVRSYLIGKGVRSTRIDVRALGSRVPEGSGVPNRVDLHIVTR